MEPPEFGCEMSEVEDYIYQHEGQQREVMLYLHQLLTADLGLRCKMRYKIPFYDGRSWICYMNAVKDAQVELAFVRGHALSNAQGLLDAKGRKQVAGIVFGSRSEIPQESLLEVIHEAMLLDETTPYPSKRKQK